MLTFQPNHYLENDSKEWSPLLFMPKESTWQQPKCFNFSFADDRKVVEKMGSPPGAPTTCRHSECKNVPFLLHPGTPKWNVSNPYNRWPSLKSTQLARIYSRMHPLIREVGLKLLAMSSDITSWVLRLLLMYRRLEKVGLGVVEKQEDWGTDLAEGLGKENSRSKEISSKER